MFPTSATFLSPNNIHNIFCVGSVGEIKITRRETRVALRATHRLAPVAHDIDSKKSDTKVTPAQQRNSLFIMNPGSSPTESPATG